jgi:hypothetical protein
LTHKGKELTSLSLEAIVRLLLTQTRGHMTTISLFQTNNEREQGMQVQWDPSWGPDTKLQALKKYCGNKYFWVDRGQRREHVAITIQVLLDEKVKLQLRGSENKYVEQQFKELFNPSSLPN